MNLSEQLGRPTIHSAEYFPPEVDDDHPLPIKLSKDHGCNFAGLCLVHMTQRPDLVFKWGARRDNPGEFIFLSNSGASITDYIMLSFI